MDKEKAFLEAFTKAKELLASGLVPENGHLSMSIWKDHAFVILFQDGIAEDRWIDPHEEPMVVYK